MVICPCAYKADTEAHPVAMDRVAHR